MTVSITDDLDGSANAETVEFSLRGATYSIDLSKKNQAALDKALKPYVDAGTKVSRRGKVKGRKSTPSADTAAVRAWAAKQGLEVSPRGRVSQTVIDAYRSAQ